MSEILFDDPEDLDVDEDGCDCEWRCNGMGTLTCDGCGGDQCVCYCGGEYGGDCPGNCNHPTCPEAAERDELDEAQLDAHGDYDE